MYKVFKPKGRLSNITITNEKTGSSVILGRYSLVHKDILLDQVIIPEVADEWSFSVTDETGKLLAMTCFRGHKPVRAKIKKDEQDVTSQSEAELKSKAKAQAAKNAYDFLMGYTDDLDD